jgi:[acyl-carrier-protein] S-malonyltransferase
MKIAYIFPGQGAQYLGMGKDLYENSPQAKKIFDEADSFLGFSLTRLCFEGPFEELTKTENCQPAVLTASIAALVAFAHTYPDRKPSYVAGLSLGEYSALVAAGIINFHDAVTLVRKRGEFMEAAAKKNPGGMNCILGLEPDAVSLICRQTHCEVANLNCPGQVVISGTKEALEAATALATERGARRVISLDVSGAFHCSLMNEASLKLKAEIEKVVFNKPQYPLVSNVDAKEQESPEIIKGNLVKQVNSTTRWEASMRYLLQKGVEGFYEIGPGTVLKGLFKKIDPNAKVVNVGKWEEI